MLLLISLEQHYCLVAIVEYRQRVAADESDGDESSSYDS